jgi:hypothetical protein
MSARAVRLAAAALMTAACADDRVAPAPVPLFGAVTIEQNANNVLAAIVSANVRFADSVAVRFRLKGAGEGADSVTPAGVVAAGPTRIAVLGLLPASQYEIRIVAYGNDRLTVSAPLELTTDALPGDLPSYTASGVNPLPGYVAMAAGMYGLVLDNTGRVVWYHRFPNGPWLNFMAQANGRYVARLVTPDQTDVESWVELDPLGNVTRLIDCEMGLQPRFHDLLTEQNGAYWILCDETRTMDLTEFGGAASARVTAQAIQHISAEGELLFHWTPFDHFDITDVEPAFRTGLNVNWTHANALDLDRDGNLLVSFRNLNEITKIDSHSGEVLWRLGGRRNGFTLGDGSELFAGQHSVRSLPSGEFLLLDNVGDSAESRVERWAVDVSAGVARTVGSYGSAPEVRTLVGGSVQALSTTRTLVSFGTEGRVEEYDSDGLVRWRIDGTPGYVFRAQRFPSLYRPGVGAAR